MLKFRVLTWNIKYRSVSKQTFCQERLQRATCLFRGTHAAGQLSFQPGRINKPSTSHQSFLRTPTKPRELAAAYTDTTQHVTHRGWNHNLHFDTMHFIFCCVVSEQSLRVLISVLRLLLLLTHPECLRLAEEMTVNSDLSLGHAGFQLRTPDYRKVLQQFLH